MEGNELYSLEKSATCAQAPSSSLSTLRCVMVRKFVHSFTISLMWLSASIIVSSSSEPQYRHVMMNGTSCCRMEQCRHCRIASSDCGWLQK